MIKYTSANIKMWSRLGSCGAFGIAAKEIAKENEKALFVTSDLCYTSGLRGLEADFSSKLYNCGIAEQNMVGVAAGLANEGFIPFATSFATFSTARCMDQIRVNMGYMGLKVKLVGIRSGLSISDFGATHISIEDIAIVRSIPNIVILSPADCTETIKATIAASKINSPVYLRLSGPMNNPIVYNNDYDFEVGKAITLRNGEDVSIIATGTMVYNSLKAAEILSEIYSIQASVIDMHTIKPLDNSVIDLACNSGLIVTVEEHSKIGGLGAAISEYLSEKVKKPPQLILGLKDEYKHAGDYNYLIRQYGLTPEQITESILLKYKTIKG